MDQVSLIHSKAVASCHAAITCWRTVSVSWAAAEIDVVRRHLSTRLPAPAGEFVTGAACMYVNTADEHFVVSRHSTHEGVVGSAASPVTGSRSCR